MNETWSPWKTHSTLPPPLRKAEAERQKTLVEELLGTSLHGDFRAVLRAVHGDLSLELENMNDNGRT